MSISSTLKTISYADKMSVPQLQQAVKDGTIPAYIAVPLIQERMKDKQEAAMKAAAAQQQQPPVADQVMAAADQEALAGLPTGMPQQYATGGIVAFAEGDLVDDEDEEDYRDALIEAELMKTSRMRPDSFATVNKTPATGLGYGNIQGQQMNADKTKYSGDGINALIGSAAEKHGVPVTLAQNIARAESGGTMNMKGDPRSTAKGPFGMLESTWLGMGGTRENRADPEANVDIGTKLIRSNAESLKKSLGRNPTYGEVYAAHHFGSGVSKMLKNADPKESIEQGLSMFESPKRVSQIMAANPHLKGQTVGSVMAMMDKKGGQGIVEMADGGVAGLPNNAMNSMRYAQGGIARFAGEDESLVKTPSEIYDTVFPEEASRLRRLNPLPYIGYYGVEAPANLWGAAGKAYADYQKNAIDWLTETPKEGERRKLEQNLSPTPKTGEPMPGRVIGPGMPQPAPTKEQLGKGTPAENRALQIQEENRMAAKSPESIRSQAAPVAPDGGGNGDGKKGGEEPPPPPKASPFEEFWADYKQQKSEIGKQKELDKWLGLLNAGLGMMGGTNQNAMVNIGQGAMFGAQQYGQARRATAADEAALMKAGVAAKRYEQLGEIAQSGQELTKEQKDAVLRQRQEEAQNKKIAGYRDDLREYEKMYTARIAKQFPVLTPDDPKYKQMVAAMYDDPQYKELWKMAYPNVKMPTGAPAGSATMRFNSKGELV